MSSSSQFYIFSLFLKDPVNGTAWSCNGDGDAQNLPRKHDDRRRSFEEMPGQDIEQAVQASKLQTVTESATFSLWRLSERPNA